MSEPTKIVIANTNTKIFSLKIFLFLIVSLKTFFVISKTLYNSNKVNIGPISITNLKNKEKASFKVKL